MSVHPGDPPQHTTGHLNCPACDHLRETVLLCSAVSAEKTFRDASARWLESRELSGSFDRARYVRPRTLKDDRAYVKALNAFFAELPLCQIHAGHLRQYQVERSKRVAAMKVNQELSVMRRILTAASLWTPQLEAAYDPLRIEAADVPRAMSPDEQAHFLQVAASRKRWELAYWYALVALDTTCNGC